MVAFASTAARLLSKPRYQLLIRLTQRGQRACVTCGYIGSVADWRDYVCPECGRDGNTHGYIDGDKLAGRRVNRTA